MVQSEANGVEAKHHGGSKTDANDEKMRPPTYRSLQDYSTSIPNTCSEQRVLHLNSFVISRFVEVSQAYMRTVHFVIYILVRFLLTVVDLFHIHPSISKNSPPKIYWLVQKDFVGVREV